MKPAVRVFLVILFVVAAIVAWRVLPATRTVSEPVAQDTAAVLSTESDAAISTASQAPSVDAAPLVTSYTCGDVTAEFTAQGEHTGALEVAGITYHLSHSIAASGAKYETASGIAPRAVFWVKGEQALLEISGQDDRTCTAVKQPQLPTTANGAIENIEWQAVEMNHRPLSSNVTITMTLDGAGRIAGRSGCNRYTGPYAIDTTARTLQVTGPVAGTRIACVAPEMMAAEDSFNTLLPTITRYQLEDGPVLVIYAGADDVLRLSPASAQ